MRFGVLGPIQVVDDSGEPVALTAAKPRALLAILLATPNTAVSADRLLDLLWDDGPPASARANLQVYVHRLRRALGEARIQHSPAGYQLVVEPDEVDADVFAELAEDGRRALADGDPAAASEAFRRALTLWRDDAYPGVDVEVVRIEAIRLMELRAAATEGRFDAELALGRHAAITPELTGLVSRHPLREHLRGQLMTALYRCGRAAEALEVYREGRHLSVEEHGIDPGPELRGLEQAILAEDPALKGPRPSRPGRPYPRPAQLPPADRAFTGRDDEFRQLAALLTGASSGSQGHVVAVNGPGGVGKSALALQAAHAVADDFPDGQLYVNLHGATPGTKAATPFDVLGRMLRALGFDDSAVPSDLDEAAALFRSVTAERRILIALDNASGAAQVRPLLPAPGSGSVVVVTSRSVLAALDGATHIALHRLSDDESVTLLGRLAGGDRVSAEPETAREIAAMCDNLPLALRIAGARLVSRPDWDLAALRDRLRDEAARLDELEHADLAVRASGAVSVVGLPATAAALFALLGVVDLPEFSVGVVSALADREIRDVRADLDRLVDAQLLIATPQDRYTQHDLLRLYAKELARGQVSRADRTAATTRVLHHFLAHARAAGRILAPARESRMVVGVRQEDLTVGPADLGSGDAAAAWLRAEAANLVAVMVIAARIDDVGWPVTVGISAALPQALHSQGLWMEFATISAIALDVATRAERPDWLKLANHDVGMSLTMLGTADAATPFLEEYRRLCEEQNDLVGLGRALDSLGNSAAAAKRWDEARNYHEQAIEIMRQTSDDAARGRALTNLAWAVAQSSGPRAALPFYEEALRIKAQAGDRVGMAVTLLNLGQAHLHLNDGAAALATLDQAAQVFANVGDTRRLALTRWKGGNARYALGRTAAAKLEWRAALVMVRDLGAIDDEEIESVLAKEPPPLQPTALREV